MSARWPALALLTVLVAPGGQALTLLGHEQGPPTTLVVRVDEPPLQAQARGNVSLTGADVGEELVEVDVSTGPWRGFANVTNLTASGEGWLVLADRAGGIAVPVPEPAREPDATPDDASEDEEEEPAGRGTQGSNPSEASASPSSQPTSEGERAASPPSSEPSSPASDGEGGWPVRPGAIALGMLALGAFLVERWTRTEDQPDP